MTAQEIERKIGELRGEKASCADDNSGCHNWCLGGTCDLVDHCVSKAHRPYMSDLNVVMELAQSDWCFEVYTEFQSDLNCFLWVVIIKSADGLVMKMHADTIILAICGAICMAFIEMRETEG